MILLSTWKKISGDLISKVPVVSKSEIDETLIETSERLGKIESNKMNKILKDFSEVRSSQVRVFIDNINKLNELYNKPLEFLIDKEYVYIKG